MYNFNLPPIIARNLPVRLRLPRVIGWIRNLLYPLNLIHLEFDELRAEIDAHYRFNGLTHSMEWLLNDIYDPVLRRIEIVVEDTQAVGYFLEDFEPPDTLFIQDHELASVLWMGDEDYNNLEPIDYEFTVRVWFTIEFDREEARKLLDRYRFAGLRPRFVWWSPNGEIQFADDPGGEIFTGG